MKYFSHEKSCLRFFSALGYTFEQIFKNPNGKKRNLYFHIHWFSAFFSLGIPISNEESRWLKSTQWNGTRTKEKHAHKKHFVIIPGTFFYMHFFSFLIWTFFCRMHCFECMSKMNIYTIQSKFWLEKKYHNYIFQYEMQKNTLTQFYNKRIDIAWRLFWLHIMLWFFFLE